MAFWVYMLHCKGGVFYVGHSENLEARLHQHRHGLFKGFTSDKLPAELVWSEQFGTRLEALESERRIKGWSRAKKLALIRGDWVEISRLAKGRTVLRQAQDERSRGKLEIDLKLIPHPAFPPSSARSVEVKVTATDWNDVLLDFRIEGEDIIIGEWRASERADGLWKSTCFELFLRDPQGESYFEFNFAPSSQWAAYTFERYRQGMHDLDMAVEPHLEFDLTKPLRLSVDLDLSNTPNVPMLASISAVIEEQDGTKSYWALDHPPGDKPDFHHPDCFVIEIPAARLA